MIVPKRLPLRCAGASFTSEAISLAGEYYKSNTQKLQFREICRWRPTVSLLPNACLYSMDATSAAVVLDISQRFAGHRSAAAPGHAGRDPAGSALCLDARHGKRKLYPLGACGTGLSNRYPLYFGFIDALGRPLCRLRRYRPATVAAYLESLFRQFVGCQSVRHGYRHHFRRARGVFPGRPPVWTPEGHSAACEQPVGFPLPRPHSPLGQK